MLAVAAKMEKRSSKEDRGDSGNVVTWVVLSVAVASFPNLSPQGWLISSGQTVHC